MILCLLCTQDKSTYKDDFGDSDNENVPDAYLARVQAEAKERDSDEGDDDSDESTDEDFKPGEENDDEVADEFDSNIESSSDDSDDGDSDSAAKKEKRAKKHERKEKKKQRSEKRETSGVCREYYSEEIYFKKKIHFYRGPSRKVKDLMANQNVL